MNILIWRKWTKAAPAARKKLMTQLLRENEPLVISFVRRFTSKAAGSPSHLREDFEQAARIGLVKAIETWRPAKKGPSSFSHWAFIHMRQEVQLVACEALPISCPRDIMFASTHKAEAHRALTGEAIDAADVGRREKIHEQVMGWEFFYNRDHGDDTTPAIEADIDRHQDLQYLREFLDIFVADEEKVAFWDGKRPDIVTEAQTYVAWRRELQ